MKKQFAFELLIIMIGVCTTASAIFDPMPGDQLWLMINQIGLINQTIAGCVMPITAKDIGTTGYVISAPGNYAFIQDVNYSVIGFTPAPAIRISTSDVSLNLNNFVLSTGNANAVLISVDSGVSNVVIKDAHLTGGRHSIQLVGNNSYIAIANVATENSTQEGILIATGASHIACNQISGQGHGSHGIAINGTNSDIAILNSFFAGNTGNGALVQGTNVYIAKSSATGNSMNGFNINTGSNLVMYQCRGSNNTINGIQLNNITGAIVHDIITDSNQNAGTECTDLSGLQLSNVNSDRDGIGIRFADNIGVTLENVVITRAVNDGLETNGTSETDSLYENISVYIPGSNGINFFDVHSQMILENINVFQPLGVSPTDGFGIEFAFNTDNVIMRDVTVMNPENHGIHFDVFTASTDILIDDAYVSRAAGGIVFEANAERVQITNSQCINNASSVSAGIDFNATSTGIIIQNAICMDNAFRGISIDTFTTPINFDGVEIENCFIMSNTLDGITIAGAIDASVTENTVINNALTSAASNGITLGTTVSGVSFSYVGFNDLVYNTAGINSFNLQVTGNGLLFPARFSVGIAGNFLFCDTSACNYDEFPGNMEASRFNSAEFSTSTGWVGTSAGAHWVNVSCRS